MLWFLENEVSDQFELQVFIENSINENDPALSNNEAMFEAVSARNGAI